MFENLTEKLTRTFKNISGQGKLSANNMESALREVRLSLLEADVALPIVKDFVEQVKQKALGQNVLTQLKPDQMLIKIVQEELTQIMGEKCSELNLKTQPPAIILMAGLQGSGKTTSTAKLARYLQDIEKKKVMVVSTDIYRPAAIDQLKILAQEIGAEFYPSTKEEKPLSIVKGALDKAKKSFSDVLIIDTAGRLHIDDQMMSELSAIHKATNPIETLFVLDSMTGQDAANIAKTFNEKLALTGVILSKTDGDARGGAALSIKHITGLPIKFIGTGEKIDALEPFHPDRIASRILGMGDMLSLIEEVNRKTDQETSKKLAKKIQKGRGFDLDDFRKQLLQMNNMGGVMGMMSKIPGMSNVPQQALNQVNDKMLTRTVAIINSMTPKERRIPKIIIGSRKKRIAQGAGTTIQEVNRLLSQFTKMQKMVKKISKPGALKQMMRGMPGMSGMAGLSGLSDLSDL